MSIKIDDEVRLITDFDLEPSKETGKVVSIYNMTSGDIAIVEFPDRVEKVPVSNLSKVERGVKPETEASKEERTVTEEQFAKTAVDLIKRESHDNITLMLGFTQFVAELHKALFGNEH